MRGIKYLAARHRPIKQIYLQQNLLNLVENYNKEMESRPKFIEQFFCASLKYGLTWNLRFIAF